MSQKRQDGANGAAGGFAMAAFSVLALSFGAPAQAETLLDAIDLAYSTNPALRAERERARSVDEGIAQARAGVLPTVTLQGQGGLSETETKIGPPPGATNTTVGRPQNPDPENVTAQVVQPIFRGGRTYYGIRQASAAAKAAHATYRSSEQQFLIEVITAFMDVRRDEESVRIRENNVSVLRKQVEAAQARFDVGEGTRTDIAQAGARLSGGQAGLAQARAQLDASRAAYERIVGQKPGTLDAPPALPVLAASLDDAVNTALDANPDLRAAKLNAEAAEFAIGVSRSQLLPQADIVAQAAIDRQNYSYAGGLIEGRSRTDSSSIVGRVTIPLFDAGLARSQTRQSKINSFRAEALEMDTRNRVVESVNSAWSRYLAAQVVQTASEAQVSANETAFEGVQQEQQVGLRTFLDVLDAEQELLNSRLSAVNAQRDSYIAAHNLLATYGGLSVESLQARVGQYHPEKYYNRAKRTIIWTGVPKLKSKPPK